MPQRQRYLTTSLPAPVKGLNTVDALVNMNPAYGLSIQNFIATPQGLSQRTGFRQWATGMPAAVTSLIQYNGRSTAQSRLFAVSGAAIYDVTSGGAVSAPVVSGLSPSSPYWQYAAQTYSTGSANYVICVNGTDAPQIYDGTTWTACTQVTTPTAPGQFKTTDNNGNTVPLSSFVDITLHQQRLWFVRANSTIAYYCDIAQVGGNLNAFDFGPLFGTGGRLHKLATWTIDAGSGSQSMLVAISNRGDVAVYGGNNPATAATWSLIGTYKIGAPVGRRCTTQYAGDLLVLTQDGLYPMSKYLQSARLDSTAAITYMISPTISDLVSANSNASGFETTVYPGQNLLLLNIPQGTQANNFQFCFHTITGGWTQFTGWPAQCFTVFNDAMYFGGVGYVALAFIGYKDNVSATGVGGDNIVATALSAFSQLNAVGVRKHVKQVKPYLVTGQSNPTISIGVNTDFSLIPIVGSATVNPVTGAVWDNARWDDVNATWVGSLTTYNQWATPLCYPGEYVALAVSLSCTSQTVWTSTSIKYVPGGQDG